MTTFLHNDHITTLHLSVVTLAQVMLVLNKHRPSKSVCVRKTTEAVQFLVSCLTAQRQRPLSSPLGEDPCGRRPTWTAYRAPKQHSFE